MPKFNTKAKYNLLIWVGEDISFDLSLIAKYGVNVFAFDPTPKSINWVRLQKLSKQFHFFEYEIADYDGIARFYPPKNAEYISHTLLYRPVTSHRFIEVEVRKLRTLMEVLGNQKIDILKMDIEGAEYAVIQDIMNSSIEVSQILVEFHHRLPDIGALQTKRAVQLLNS